MSFKHLKNRIEKILRNNFETRDSDKALYYEVCKEICAENGYNIDQIAFKAVMLDKVVVLPTPETVSRLRRLLQEHDPSLWGNRREERMRAQEDYIDFVRG